MQPGEIVTCACCQAKSRATWTPQDRAWEEGFPLLLAWMHGPHLRVEVMPKAPTLCIWCHERREVMGDDAPPLYRPAPGALPGELPRLKEAGEERPAELEGSERNPGVGVGGPAAPLESPSLIRYRELAQAFFTETGLRPPGKENPGAVDDAALWKKWTEFCRARAVAAQPPKKAKPQGQLGLF
jgi:hypothetical protein